MKKITALFLALSLLLSLIACGAKDAWQEQYDLGMRYLNDGSYQEAVIAFTAAIEIDPKRPEAYLGAAEAYIAADDIDAAIAILEKGYAATNDDTLKNRLDEIKSGTFNDYWGRAKQLSGYDENGALEWYHLYTYDAQGRRASATSYDAAGNQTNHVDCEYDENGNALVSFAYVTSSDSNPVGSLIRSENTYNADGLLTKKVETYSDGRMRYDTYQYDQNGNCIREDNYGGGGNLTGYRLYEYNAAGLKSKWIYYDSEGKMTGYDTFSYNDAGKLIEQRSYSNDGKLHWRGVTYYDANGHRTGSESYDGDGNLLSSTSYQN